MIGISVDGTRLTRHCKRSFANDFAKTQSRLNEQSVVVQSMHTVNRLIWALAQLAEIDEKRAILFKIGSEGSNPFCFQDKFQKLHTFIRASVQEPKFLPANAQIRSVPRLLR